jgi:heme-degrading monooxygenase HmoA
MADAPRALPPRGSVAVIFVAQRSAEDERGYAEAAARMEALAAEQPGYLGLDSARGADRLGVTVSYWADDACALGWKANAEHALVRDMGRARWYDWYRLIVTTVERAYDWTRDPVK